MNEFSSLSDDRLHEIIQGSRQKFSALAEKLKLRPDMMQALAVVTGSDDKLKVFIELAVKKPDLMGLVLHAGLLAVVTGCSAASAEAELTSRNVKGN